MPKKILDVPKNVGEFLTDLENLICDFIENNACEKFYFSVAHSNYCGGFRAGHFRDEIEMRVNIDEDIKFSDYMGHRQYEKWVPPDLKEQIEELEKKLEEKRKQFDYYKDQINSDCYRLGMLKEKLENESKVIAATN